MSGLWGIVIPEESKNYVPNPSLESDEQGYTAYSTGTAGGTIARSTDWQKYGLYSYRIEKTAGADGDIYSTRVAPRSYAEFLSGDDVTFSVDLKIESGTARLTLSTDVGSDYVDIVGPVEGRYSVSVTLSGVPTQVYGFVMIRVPTGVVYADGWQIERKAYATTFIDGDQPGCVWTGKPHYSASTRPATTRAGGKIVNLDDYSYVVKTYLGLGASSFRHLTLSQAQLAGDLFRGTHTESRAITLELENSPMPTTREDFHSKRKALWNVLKPNAIPANEPIRMLYYGANADVPAEIYAVYDSGFEMGVLDGFTENSPIRFIAYDPRWYENGNTADVLNTSDTVSNFNYAGRRIDGIWENLGSGLTGAVNCFAEGLDGTIYLGGLFTNVGTANGDYIVAYDPELKTFSALGTGANNYVQALAVGPDGKIYAGGYFTSAGGVANTQYLAAWNPDTSLWESVHTGGNNYVSALAFGPDGTLYVGGAFTQLNSTAYNCIAQMDTAGSWAALGTGITYPSGTPRVTAIAVTKTGIVYAGGAFDTAGGNSADHIAQWDIDGAAWSSLGTGTTTDGLDGQCNALTIGPEGALYVGGFFDTINDVAGFNLIAKWDQNSWFTLSGGLTPINSTESVACLAFDENGILYAGGDFTAADGATVKGLAAWNGTTWVNAGIDLPSSNYVSALFLNNAQTALYIGTDNAGTATIPGSTTVENTGTDDAYPIIKITRSGGTSARVLNIENTTTGQALYCDYDLLDGETLTIDLTPGNRSVKSSIHGDVWYAVRQASNLAAFRLAPGNNEITAQIDEVGSPTVTASMQWRITHASADGVAA